MFAESPDGLHWEGEMRFKRVSRNQNIQDLQSVHVETVSPAVI